MAYMSQEHKKEIANNIKPILKKYGVKASFSVSNHSTINMNISKGPIDFLKDTDRDDYLQVNPYHYEKYFTGKAKEFFCEVIPLLFGERFFDNSDAMTDYFHTSHYVRVNVGRFGKNYILEK